MKEMVEIRGEETLETQEMREEERTMKGKIIKRIEIETGKGMTQGADQDLLMISTEGIIVNE